MAGDGQSPGEGKPQQGQSAGSDPSGRKEKTPDGPQDQSQDSPGQNNEPGADGQPKGNKAGHPEGNKNATQPEEATGDPLMAVDGKGQWGNLPVHVRDLFRAEGGRDLPPRYRDWIDSYYRRLNERDSD